MKKKILIIVLLIASITTFAQNYADFSSEEYKQYISSQLTKSIEINKKINDDCINQSTKNEPSKDTIQQLSSLNLTEQQMASTLGYFAIKAHLKCIGDSSATVLGFLNEARILGIKDNTAFFTQANNLLADQKMLARYQYYLLKLPINKQQKIKSIEELNQPFNAEVLSKIKTMRQ